VGDFDECEDYIQQTLDSNRSRTGTGDIQVPVTASGYTWTGYGGSGVVYASGNSVAWAAGTGQRSVWDLWVSKGRQYEDGIAVLDGLYLAACKPYDESKTTGFGHVGDIVTFYLTDGTAIDCLIADEKGTDAASPWGHENGDGTINIIEFEVDVSVANGRNPGEGSGWHEELGKGDVVSATNEGVHPDLVGKTGIVGESAANMSGLGTKAATDAINECKAESAYDNSTLAAALVSYSMSRSTQQDDSEESSPIYQSVCEGVDELGPDDYCASYHYHSCDRGVAAAVYWTGADLDFPAGAPSNQYEHCMTSPLWTAVTEDGQTIDIDDDRAKDMDLEPGDIAITLGDHIVAYVGEDAVNQGYDEVIKGVEGADVGKPVGGSCMVSASAHQRGANIHPGHEDSRGYRWFRYVGDYPDRDKYSGLADQVTLENTDRRGTECDCMECGEETSKKFSSGTAGLGLTGENQGVVRFAKTFLGQPYVFGASHTRGPGGYDDPDPHPTDCTGLVLTAYYCGANIAIQEKGGGGCTGDNGGSVEQTFWGNAGDMGNKVWEYIEWDEMESGDVILIPYHAVMFVEWADEVGGNAIIIEETTPEGCRETTLTKEYAGNRYYKDNIRKHSEGGDKPCILRWVGDSGTDTTTKLTRRSSNTGVDRCSEEDMKNDCYSTVDFSDTVIIGADEEAIDTEGTHISGQMSSAMKGAKVETKAGDAAVLEEVLRENAGKFDRYVIYMRDSDGGIDESLGEHIVMLCGKSNTKIFLVNQYVEGNEAANETTDATVRRLESRYGNVHVIDWREEASVRSEYLLDDGVHLSEDGARAFAEVVHEGLVQHAGCNESGILFTNSDVNLGSDEGSTEDHGTNVWRSVEAGLYTVESLRDERMPGEYVEGETGGINDEIDQAFNAWYEETLAAAMAEAEANGTEMPDMDISKEWWLENTADGQHYNDEWIESKVRETDSGIEFDDDELTVCLPSTQWYRDFDFDGTKGDDFDGLTEVDYEHAECRKVEITYEGRTVVATVTDKDDRLDRPKPKLKLGEDEGSDESGASREVRAYDATEGVIVDDMESEDAPDGETPQMLISKAVLDALTDNRSELLTSESSDEWPPKVIQLSYRFVEPLDKVTSSTVGTT
jgi:hypothetical protein